MDFSNLITNFANTMGDALPSVIGALFVLLIGSFLAKLISKSVAKRLRKMNLDERINRE